MAVGLKRTAARCTAALSQDFNKGDKCITGERAGPSLRQLPGWHPLLQQIICLGDGLWGWWSRVNAVCRLLRLQHIQFIAKANSAFRHVRHERQQRVTTEVPQGFLFIGFRQCFGTGTHRLSLRRRRWKSGCWMARCGGIHGNSRGLRLRFVCLVCVPDCNDMLLLVGLDFRSMQCFLGCDSICEALELHTCRSTALEDDHGENRPVLLEQLSKPVLMVTPWQAGHIKIGGWFLGTVIESSSRHSHIEHCTFGRTFRTA
mmetsp:Transcript_16419/g.28745  ORF Transcript_16419/g.28745 Transcript_16419/m.28745 type:complete len:259 (+) Transcript_16419:970-1746(+)